MKEGEEGGEEEEDTRVQRIEDSTNSQNSWYTISPGIKKCYNKHNFLSFVH